MGPNFFDPLHLSKLREFIHYLVFKIQGDFFHWYSPISVPKRKPPSSQSQHRIYWNSSCDWLIFGFLFDTEIRGGQLNKSPCILKMQAFCSNVVYMYVLSQGSLVMSWNFTKIIMSLNLSMKILWIKCKSLNSRVKKNLTGGASPLPVPDHCLFNVVFR